MIVNNKWVKIIDNKGTFDITQEISRIQYLDFVEDDVQISTNTTEIKGTDGVLVGSSTFQPFKLTLRFAYVGYDIKDYHLFKTRLRAIIFKRKAYYIVHSDFPGRKYAVVPESISYEDKYGRNGEVSISFSCVKGYSESLKDTSEYSLKDGTWQFENNLLSNDEIKYKHNTSYFKIYNGSSDKIDPHVRHDLKIIINIDAPNGFKLKNVTTGDVFEYKKPIKKNQTLTLQGVHPLINGERVGVDTNWKWITLEEGFNDIEITGTNIGQNTTQWIFPFIYR